MFFLKHIYGIFFSFFFGYNGTTLRPQKGVKSVVYLHIQFINYF